MAGHTIILHGPSQRAYAHRLIDAAPAGALVTVRPAKRSVDQNSLLWALLSEISVAKPQGRKATPDRWKSIFMDALKFEVQFETGLEGHPFCIGHKTSTLTKEDFGLLIDFIYYYGAENGVVFLQQEKVV